MIPKRVKQFYVNVTDKMTEKDYDYANEILNKKELELFMKLSKSEQKHSIRIAKDIEFIIDNNETDDEEILEARKKYKELEEKFEKEIKEEKVHGTMSYFYIHKYDA